MNSSSEIVKQISKLEMTPGITNGRVTRRNVPQRLSPKSNDASSRLLSRPAKAELRIAIEKGVQIKACPATTVQSDKDIPNCINITMSETATIISGNTSGSMMKPVMPFCAGNLYLADARAAHAPKNVLTRAVTMATKAELPTALCSASVDQSTLNQSVVKPLSGKAIIVASLNANIGSKTTGA